MDATFKFSSLVVLPFWGLMIFLPRWRWTVRIMRFPYTSAAPAVVYAVLVLPRLGAIWPAVSRPTLDGIAALLGSAAGATIAWAHFLAFDLFVGRWIYLDGRKKGIRPWFMAPPLFFTLMLGPLGFLLYLGIRSASDSSRRRTKASSAVYAKDVKPESLARAAEVMKRAGGEFGALVRSALEINRPLTILGGVMLVVLLATLVGVSLDPRIITAAPAWVKPAKFAISISIYCFTFVWLLGFIAKRPRLTCWMANVVVISFIAEMTAIFTQAARGTTSHFNMTTPFNSLVWMTMGTFIVLVWVMTLLLAVLLIQQRLPDRALAWSLRLGVLISVVGMCVAFLMVRPTPAQIAVLTTLHQPHIIGAHSVGIPDGGPGLPFLGWSTVAGDLRPAHFVGLHALQLLPFLGWLLARRRVSAFLSERRRLSLVWTGGLAYLGLVLLLVWQALRGQSVIHPDGTTLVAAGALATAAAASILVNVAHALRGEQKVEQACAVIDR